MNTRQVVEYFRRRYPFFDRNLLYYFIKQRYVNFKPVYRAGRSLAAREFDQEEIEKIAALLEKYQKRREAEREAARTLAQSRPQRAGPRVLVVEDFDVHRMMLQEELEGRYELEFAASAEQAKAALQRGAFDAVILDLMLPLHRGGGLAVAHGMELLELAQQRGLKCIIVHSARISPEIEEQLRRKALPHLRKPVPPEEVADVLERELAPAPAA